MLTDEQITNLEKLISRRQKLGKSMDNDPEYAERDPHYWERAEFQNLHRMFSLLWHADLIELETMRCLQDLNSREYLGERLYTELFEKEKSL